MTASRGEKAFRDIETQLADLDIAAIEIQQTCTSIAILFESPSDAPYRRLLRMHGVVALRVLRQASAADPNYFVVELMVRPLSEETAKCELGIHHCFDPEELVQLLRSDQLVYLRIDGDYWIEVVGRVVELEDLPSET